ncbi:MAG TPA: hypothetical protein VE955_11040 [Candidatus Dormibacteraeota bacterium]|nr:hypothetical protein [Candidatus Dormibacteraeota bacterium]
MEIRRWKAFLRLKGETLVERDEDILDEFKEFVQALKRVGIDYSIIVNVEGGKTQLLGQQGQVQPISENAPQRKTLR